MDGAMRGIRGVSSEKLITDYWNAQMPTFILFKNGQKMKEIVGANPGGLQVRIPRRPLCLRSAGN